MLKTFEIKLDVEKDLYSPMQILFNVSNSDVDSVELQYLITQDEKPFDLTGKTMQMAIQNPSRKIIYQGIEIVSALEGKAICRLPQGAYLEEGIHVSEVYITDVDQTIVTSPFYFNSWQSITTQETVPTDGTTGDVYWQNILNKPLTYPPNSHTHAMAEVVGLLDALDGKANVGETGGGDGGGIALPIDIADVTGLQPALDGKVDDAEMTGKADVNHTHTFAQITAKPTTYPPDVHTHTFASITARPTTYPPDIHTHAFADITGKPATYTPSAHTHAMADVTGLETALAGKMDDGDAYLKTETYAKTETYSKAETYNRTQIDAMAFPEGGGGGATVIVEDNLLSTDPTNALSSNQGRILNETKANATHIHAIADVTGLQVALDGKVDDADLMSQAEWQNSEMARIEGKVDGKSDLGHTHTSADITDFGTAVAGAIPPEYLTGTEGDGRYQPIGVVPAHDHPEYLDQTETDALYQPIGTIPAHTHDEYLTLAEADTSFLTPTEGDGRYQAIGTIPVHDHPEYLTTTEADALFLTPAEADANFLTPEEADASYQAIGTIPVHDHPEYLTDVEADALFLTPAEGDSRYQATGVVPAHNHVVANITDFPTEMTPPLMQSGTRGGARVGNGLGMSGEYLTVKSGAGLVTSGTTYQVEINRATTDGWYVKNATGQGLTIWKGTQLEYDGLTKDPNTLYFIVG
jgi:hypothetical protein